MREEGREAGSGVTGMRQEREEAEVVTEEDLLRDESSSAEYFVAKMISISVHFQDRKYFIPQIARQSTDNSIYFIWNESV